MSQSSWRKQLCSKPHYPFQTLDRKLLFRRILLMEILVFFLSSFHTMSQPPSVWHMNGTMLLYLFLARRFHGGQHTWDENVQRQLITQVRQLTIRSSSFGLR